MTSSTVGLNYVRSRREPVLIMIQHSFTQPLKEEQPILDSYLSLTGNFLKKNRERVTHGEGENSSSRVDISSVFRVKRVFRELCTQRVHFSVGAVVVLGVVANFWNLTMISLQYI